MSELPEKSGNILRVLREVLRNYLRNLTGVLRECAKSSKGIREENLQIFRRNPLGVRKSAKNSEGIPEQVLQNYLRNLLGVLGESAKNPKGFLLRILRRLPEQPSRSHQGIS